MKFALLPLVLALSACSLTPKFQKPDAPIPASYAQLGGNTTGQQHGADVSWRSMFIDPRLQRLIEHSLENNRNLRVAVLNVEIVQAQLGIQRAARFPTVEANGTLSRERTAASTLGGSRVPPYVSDSRSVGLGINAFELDLFGRVRSLTDAAFARYLASEQGRSSAELTLIAGVADAYFAERLALEQLQLSKRTLADWLQSLDLAQRLKAANQNSAIDIAQAEGQVAIAQADLEARHRALVRAGNALRLLAGADLPDDLPKSMALDQQPILTQLPAGLPSELLTRRPDILQAEQAMVAANADIGAARAAFFPRISLTTSLGYSSSAMSNLFDSDSRTWRFAPQLTLPIFDAGRLKSELRLAEVRKSSAVVDYERTIQTAFQEVSDGLAGQATFGRQILAQKQVVSAAKRRLELSVLRQRYGFEGRIELLDAQRQFYASSQTLLDLRQEEISNAVALYKALGGGLNSDFPPGSLNSGKRNGEEVQRS